MEIFLIILLFIVELILFGHSYVKTKRDFVSPSNVTLVFFMLSTACFGYSVYEYKWTCPVSIKAFLLFSLTFLIMVMVETFVRNGKVTIRIKSARNQERGIFPYFENTSTILQIKKPWNYFLFVIFASCTLIYIYRVYRSGISLGAVSLLTSIGFNKEEGDFDGISRLLYNLVRIASYVYITIFCQNVFCARQKVRENILSLLIMAMTLILTLFSGQRSAMICYIVAIVVGVGIALQESRKENKKVNTKKIIKRLVIIGILVVVVFFLLANIVKGRSLKRNFVQYMTYYFGSTTGLMWRIVEQPDLCHYPFTGYFGEKTFMGFWNQMYEWGIVRSLPADRKWISMGGAITGSAGNEYTFLCGPYIDFGFIGALLFIVIFYYAFSYVYYRKILGRHPGKKKYTTQSIYLFMYTMISMSFYQDTIRSYSRPINILYILYMIVFVKLFLTVSKKKT